jgi:hypothetical protein
MFQSYEIRDISDIGKPGLTGIEDDGIISRSCDAWEIVLRHAAPLGEGEREKEREREREREREKERERAQQQQQKYEDPRAVKVSCRCCCFPRK